MINVNNLSDLSCEDKEGKMLIAALAILTSLDKKDIDENIWGGMVHPDDALRRVAELANKIYHEEEWKSEEKKRKRDDKINKILD